MFFPLISLHHPPPPLIIKIIKKIVYVRKNILEEINPMSKSNSDMILEIGWRI